MSPRPGLRLPTVVGVLAALFGAAACSGATDNLGTTVQPSSGATSVAPTPATPAVLATLEVISTDVLVKSSGDDFASAETGRALAVGDQVRTDRSGFAEVSYFDGSYMRVDSGATLSLVELVDAPDGKAVRTGIDTGRGWQRVQKATRSGDRYEVETPVGVAAVRGTAFSEDCREIGACTFSVVEGQVEITTPDGSVTLDAGEQVTIEKGETPPAVERPGVAALLDDPFISRNAELDEADGFPALTGATGSTGTAKPTGTSTTEAKASGVVDLCALLTDAEISAALGAAVTRTGSAGTFCHYTDDLPAATVHKVTITYDVDDPTTMLATARTEADSAFSAAPTFNTAPKAVPGSWTDSVGQANQVGYDLTVRFPNLAIGVNVHNVAPAGSLATGLEPVAITLAELVATKLADLT